MSVAPQSAVATRSGSQLLIDALKRNGVEQVFGYPGGAIMPLYDALVDSGLKHYLCRHEQGAALAAEHDVVVFVDAAVRGREPFFFRQIGPVPGLGFSSHGAEPGAILALAGDLCGRVPEGYALGIHGYEFNEFGETLSPGAVDNLAAALQFLLPVLKKRTFREAAAALEGSSSGEQAPCDGERTCETESM